VTDPRPIGVFDSGVGGLTVLREILRRTPAESTIYLGDNARAPYGTRDDDEVRRFSTESIDALVERDVKAVVVACNTSTAVAIGDLRRRYDLPILGVIRPGAVTASLTTRNRRVGVIATPATIRSHAYFAAIKDENPAVEVYEHATPAFVPMVEAGELTGPDVESAVRDALAPLLGERDAAGEFIFPLPASARIDTLLLGCTHYPLLRAAIAAVAGENIAIVDSAAATASALAELLSINGLEAPAVDLALGDVGVGTTHVQLTTGDIDRFRTVASRMFGDAFPDVAAVEVGPGGAGRARTATAAAPAEVAS
jgi:glutamate racemase